MQTAKQKIPTIPVGSAVHPGETVYVRGTAHSYDPWDKPAVFEWKDYGDPRALTCAVTVASMRVTLEPDENATIAEGVEARLALPPEGLAVPPSPGHLTPLRLHSDVFLPPSQQYIILSMTGTPGAFRVFKYNSTNDTPLLVVGQTITNGLPVSFAATGHVTVWLEALAPGNAQITYAYDGTGVSEGISHADTLNVTTAGVHITMKNDYSYLPFSPVFNGTTGKKWVVATFPEPQQTNIVWDVRLVGKPSGTARLLYQRGTGAETEIPWDGTSHTLQFTNGWLNASVCLNDGPEPSPAMTLASGVVTVSGVQQGGKIIVEETGSGWRDEIAVVKNFSWNDLQRLGPNNLTMHPDFNGLLPAIKDAIIGTILFCLDTSPMCEQWIQLGANEFHGSGTWATLYPKFRENHPNLLTQEFPSARSVGAYPHDLDHFHLAIEAYPLPPTITAQTDTLDDVLETVKNEPFLVQHAALRQHFVDLLNSAYGFPNETPFMLFHTYEIESHFSPAYMTSSATAYLMPGDPVRNIRWTFANPYQTPDLTYPGSETDASAWQGKSSPPQQVWQIGFFVDRKGRVVLVPQGDTRTFKGMLSDALREE